MRADRRRSGRGAARPAPGARQGEGLQKVQGTQQEQGALRAHGARPSRRGAAAGSAVLLALALAGCASLASPAGTDALPGGDDGGASADGPEVLVRVSHHGAFVPVGWDFSSVAELTVYADGLAVTTGPTTLEYPGHLLPNLVTHRLPDASLAAIADAAADAGLLDDAPDYGMPAITDVGSTLVAITVDGTTYEHDAYALGMVQAGDLGAESGLTPEHLAAREALDGFLTTVRSQVDAAEETGTYEPDRFAVMAAPAAGAGDVAGDDGVVPAEIAWPLDVPLEGADCVVVAGEDAATLAPVLAGARQGDRFTQAGTTYDVWVRVLLPGDGGCTGTEQAPVQG